MTTSLLSVQLRPSSVESCRTPFWTSTGLRPTTPRPSMASTGNTLKCCAGPHPSTGWRGTGRWRVTGNRGGCYGEAAGAWRRMKGWRLRFKALFWWLGTNEFIQPWGQGRSSSIQEEVQFSHSIYLMAVKNQTNNWVTVMILLQWRQVLGYQSSEAQYWEYHNRKKLASACKVIKTLPPFPTQPPPPPPSRRLKVSISPSSSAHLPWTRRLVIV
jgi:hypothetical protein